MGKKQKNTVKNLRNRYSKNVLKLDSHFHGNDKQMRNSIFYEFIKFEECQFSSGFDVPGSTGNGEIFKLLPRRTLLLFLKNYLYCLTINLLLIALPDLNL